MNPTTQRTATVSDAHSLAALGRGTFVETWVEDLPMGYPPHDLASYLDTAFDQDVIAASLVDPLRRWFIAESDGVPVAYALCGPCGLPHPEATPRQGELKRLYVRRDHQHRGVGRALLERSLAWLEASFEGPLWLGVWSGNVKAQALYVAHGFRKVGEYDYPVGRTLDREHIFRRER